jgi:hypothetical protein
VLSCFAPQFEADAGYASDASVHWPHRRRAGLSWDSAETPAHAELRRDLRARWAAVKALDLHVLEPDDIAARRRHPVAGDGKYARAVVGTGDVGGLQHELDGDDNVDLVALAPHIGGCDPIIPDKVPGCARSAVGHPDRFVCQYSSRFQATTQARYRWLWLSYGLDG